MNKKNGRMKKKKQKKKNKRDGKKERIYEGQKSEKKKARETKIKAMEGQNCLDRRGFQSEEYGRTGSEKVSQDDFWRLSPQQAPRGPGRG